MHSTTFEQKTVMAACVCVCVCVCERERESVRARVLVHVSVSSLHFSFLSKASSGALVLPEKIQCTVGERKIKCGRYELASSRHTLANTGSNHHQGT